MYNKCTIIGHLGNDPVVKTTASGQTVTNFSVATSNRYTDKSGIKQEQTQWHYCTAWNKLSEICGQYLHKGSLVLVEGPLVTKRWEKKDGSGMSYRTEITVTEMKMLGGKNQSGASSPDYEEHDTVSGPSQDDDAIIDDGGIPF